MIVGFIFHTYMFTLMEVKTDAKRILQSQLDCLNGITEQKKYRWTEFYKWFNQIRKSCAR
jgi:hypothetical protein